MTKRIASLVGLALLAVSATAQIVSKVEVNVPFSFVAAGKTWNAGTYNVDIRPDNGLAVLHSNESGSRAFLTQASQSQNIGNETALRFQSYGDQWVLQSIILPGTRAEVLPSKFEKELMSRKRSATRTIVAHLER
jgi:hypothetical protein